MLSVDYELMRNRKIIDILIGDTILGNGEKMPRLSGSHLCSISTMFGYSREYSSRGGGPSRWVYMDDLLAFFIDQDRVSDLLVYLFDLDNFRGFIDCYSPDEVEEKHEKIVNAAINAINAILIFSQRDLRYVSNRYIICNIDKENKNLIEVLTSEIIDIPYVFKLKERTKSYLVSGDYDSVVTKSRTLIEEVLIYILEENNIQIKSKGDIQKLYCEVKEVLNMRTNRDYDRSINSMLSGLEKIIQAVAEMRNSNSDSHGAGRKRIAIRKIEAELVINAAITFGVYLLGVYENYQEKEVQLC